MEEEEYTFKNFAHRKGLFIRATFYLVAGALALFELLYMVRFNKGVQGQVDFIIIALAIALGTLIILAIRSIYKAFSLCAVQMNRAGLSVIFRGKGKVLLPWVKVVGRTTLEWQKGIEYRISYIDRYFRTLMMKVVIEKNDKEAFEKAWAQFFPQKTKKCEFRSCLKREISIFFAGIALFCTVMLVVTIAVMLGREHSSIRIGLLYLSAIVLLSFFFFISLRQLANPRIIKISQSGVSVFSGKKEKVFLPWEKIVKIIKDERGKNTRYLLEYKNQDENRLSLTVLIAENESGDFESLFNELSSVKIEG